MKKNIIALLALGLTGTIGLSILGYVLIKNFDEKDQDFTPNSSDVQHLTDSTDSEAIIADHESVKYFDSMPESSFSSIPPLHIFYGHTSHGSQLITGLEMLDQDIASLPDDLRITEYDGDLGTQGDIAWTEVTREALDNNRSINMVLWSWCGGVSENTSEGIQNYLDTMDRLEYDYPDVNFVYMTGHTDGTGEDGNLNRRNEQIREYCRENGKILFDFADIESWDPDGNLYPETSDACEWCGNWCDDHNCPECGGSSECAHSHCFNCYNKGKALLWLLTEITR